MRMLPFGLVLLALVCVPPVAAGGGADAAAAAEAEQSETYGMRLVAAARKQLTVPVIYDPTYRKLTYPMGDVPWYTGVCTDVVVRAYRELGVDLQELIHRSRVGSGDKNIDHRRVNVMGRFFSRKGKKLSISKDPKDYLPGDIVTYHVPEGTFSKTHVVIVSNRKTWSGVPLVIHNRGFGVQEEDWLFESRITGHYRYRHAPHIKGWSDKTG